ncbi:MAG: hypothetical protein KKB70_02550 [Proteobacteria bacterium]|nr:hypothetical protein [Pseudomonadota bacterium]
MKITTILLICLLAISSACTASEGEKTEAQGKVETANPESTTSNQPQGIAAKLKAHTSDVHDSTFDSKYQGTEETSPPVTENKGPQNITEKIKAYTSDVDGSIFDSTYKGGAKE